MRLDFGAVLVDWRLFLVGIGWTLLLTAVATILGVIVGTLGAWSRSSGGPVPRLVVGSYVELIRNTPFIVQLFFIFFGLPSAGVRLSPETASFLAMTLNLGAYATEIIRAGIQATPRGQIEAAQSLAMSPSQVFVRIVLPPALSKVWPAMVSQVVVVMLGSAVCGQISVEELSFVANLIQSRNFRAFEAFIVATAIYLCLAVLIRRVLNWASAAYFRMSR